MSHNGDYFASLPHPWHGFTATPDGKDISELVRGYIEMTSFDDLKYEVDKESGYLVVDRPQRTSSVLPAPYGFIPRTHCGDNVAALCPAADEADGDGLDIVVFSERAITRGSVFVNARVIGGIQMLDDGEADDKILAILDDDQMYKDVQDIDQLPSILIERMQHYFKTYKLWPGKNANVNVDNVYDKAHALKVIKAAQDDYEAKYGKYL